VQIPEGIPRAPERVLLVDPLAFLFVFLMAEFRKYPIHDRKMIYLPSATETAERLQLHVTRIRE
jgi:hypothetical protein